MDIKDLFMGNREKIREERVCVYLCERDREKDRNRDTETESLRD